MDERTPRFGRVALAHDWLVGLRGGEAVLDRIAQWLRPRARTVHLFTMFDDGRPLTPAVDALPRTVARLGRMPRANDLRRWLLPAYPWAVRDLSRRLAAEHRRDPFDLLISTSSVAVKNLRPPRGVRHLCYCHAPARYLWSIADEYRAGGGGAMGLGLRICGPALRAWDRSGSRHVTALLANSSHTAAQIRRCYGREPTVLHPPVRTEFFTPASAEPSPGADGPGARADRPWLVVSALEPYKRVDLAVRAARLAGVPLLIAGDGSQREALRSMAGPGVTFLGRVDDAALRDLYRSARLLLYPQIEDFGIIAVEAQACGTPVLARRAGGALDSVIEGQTGAVFDEATPEAIAGAAAAVPIDCAQACRANAERFSAQAFELGLEAALLRLLG